MIQFTVLNVHFHLSEYNESVQLYCFDSVGMICRAHELHKGPQIVERRGPCPRRRLKGSPLFHPEGRNGP